MKMYVAGQWVGASQAIAVNSPYSGEQVGEVPVAEADQIEAALATAVSGARTMANLPAHQRYAILMRFADLFDAQAEQFARLLTMEEGKPIGEARVEVARVKSLIRLSAFEGTQLRGETLPIDAQTGAEHKFAMTLRVPCGVVVAITPFNFPILLAVHKLAPAFATGNAVILKPASVTPLTTLKLTQLLLEAGAPEDSVQCLTGSGSTLGPALCADQRVRKVSFTGSGEVGREITRVAGVKKLSLELGSNSPLVVLPDADLEMVAQATAVGGFANAGQVCISTQRVIVDKSIYSDFLDAARTHVEAIKIGDPLKDDTKLSAMITQREAQRVENWVDEAVASGGKLVTGGKRDGAVYQPTIVADVDPAMRISCDELFGPAIAVTAVSDIDQAIDLANDTHYGLGAGIFTRDVNHALRFARQVQSGNIMINWTPQWRADLQPYGGLKQSGIGKEGPKYTVKEMTEIKTVVFHGLDS